MPHTSNPTLDLILYSLAGLLLLFIGYRVGKWIGTLAASKLIASKEQDLFTAQKSFKSLYEQELANLKDENASLHEQVKTLNDRVEDYRKKAAGFGGLFNTGGKRADAMYALLLENEALEEALYSQNEKLRQERTDSLKDQLRATSYRQLMNDERIKAYVAEILDEKALPRPDNHVERAALPAGEAKGEE